MSIAKYIVDRYRIEHGNEIDEMKLHKMLYLAQRESFIEKNSPLFDAVFYGWKYGPVLKEVRSAYKDGTLEMLSSGHLMSDIKKIIDKIFDNYANKNSWSLSRLTHGELSWKRSREGIAENVNGDKPMNNEDIKKDAERIKARRKMLRELGRV